MRRSSVPPSPARFSRATGAAVLACAFSTLALAACGDRAHVDARLSLVAARPATLDEVTRWRGEVTLEENREVITVFPQVSVTSAGDYLVADGREAQIRVYAGDGRLRRWFGARGSGPEEFTRPAAALPGDGGTVWVVDFSGKYAVFGPIGKGAVQTGRVPVGAIYTAKPMDDGQMLVVGRSGPGEPYLHLWDPRQRRITRSFFVPPVRRGFEEEAVVAGVMDASVRGDSIAALFALTDSIFLFTRDGRRTGAIPLRSRHLRPLATKLSAAGREGFVRWGATFSMLSRVFWLPGGSFLVQYWDTADGDQRFTLMHVARDGEPLFEIQGTPRLIAVAPDGETLVFADSRTDEPNQWRLAALR